MIELAPLMDEQYFSRCATWSRLNDRLVVHDSSSPWAPRMVTMEPWHEIAFLAADGEHTIGEFVTHMGSQYEGGEPPGLREQIHRVVQELMAEGIIKTHPSPAPLPAYFAEDYFTQPAEIRKEQMQRDGRIPPDEPTEKT